VFVELSASGSEMRRHTLPASDGAEEAYRSVKSGHDGKIYLMKTSDAGFEIVKVTP
jgi:hypothetical protein